MPSSETKNVQLFSSLQKLNRDLHKWWKIVSVLYYRYIQLFRRILECRHDPHMLQCQLSQDVCIHNPNELGKREDCSVWAAEI